MAIGLGDKTLLTGASDGCFRAWDLRSILPGPPPAGSFIASEKELVAITNSALGIDAIPSNEPAEVDPDEGFVFAGPDPYHSGRVTAISYAPGGSSLVSAGADGRLMFRKADSGKALAPPSLATPHSDGLFDARFLPAEPFVVTAAGDGVVTLWDVQGVLKGGTDYPSRVRRMHGHTSAA